MELIFYQNNKNSVPYRLLVGFSINNFFFLMLPFTSKFSPHSARNENVRGIFLLKLVDLKNLTYGKIQVGKPNTSETNLCIAQNVLKCK